MERERERRREMGWSESEGTCKKHPNQRQSPGVCSSCLRERLYQLSSSSNNTSASFSSSPVSAYSFASASSAASPPLHLPSSAAAGNNHDGLFGRSRSLAVVARIGDAGVVANKKKKTGGFWSKLLRPINKRRNENTFLHSKTMKEVPANWAPSHK